MPYLGVPVNELRIHVDTSSPNRPLVRLLVDGTALLTADGHDTPNDPADILDTGALLPASPARRVAFYGCGCGEFGCSSVAGLVVEDADQVAWKDFRAVTGTYVSALPEPEDGPDPVEAADQDLPARPLDLPTLTFDRARYLAVVRAAMADRSWETRARAVVRHLRSLRPGMTHWAAEERDAVTIHHQVGDMVWSTDVPLPPGRPEHLAASLLVLLDDGVDPRRISAEGLWR